MYTCPVRNLPREMNSCMCWENPCDMLYDSRIYSNKIRISEFKANTTLEDLRIRFSVYGSIKDCYFVSHPNRHACITFNETYSEMQASYSNIYLHGQKLTVYKEKFIEKKELKCDLKIVGDNTVHINELNDDCILEIFEYLSIIERVKLKRVCTRWRIMANVSLQSLRHLNFKISSEVFKNFSCNLENFNHEKKLMELLHNLEQRELQTETSLSFYKNHNPSKIIASLNMHLLAVDCRNLNTLIIRCSTYDEHILSRILTVNQELRHIEIIGNPHITGESLIHLSEKIHTFTVENCDNLQSNHLFATLKRLKNLKHLKLSHHDGGVAHIFNEYCQNLETLVLIYMKLPVKDFNIFLPVTNLTNLRELKMNVFAKSKITETFMVNLCQNCQELRRLELYCLLTISDSWRINERIMNAITSLPKLEDLSLMCSGINLANLHGLHKIKIRDCNVNEKQIVSVIRNSPELRYFYIYGNYYITENILSEARAISASRCNDVILELATKGFDERSYVIYNGKIY